MNKRRIIIAIIIVVMGVLVFLYTFYRLTIIDSLSKNISTTGNKGSIAGFRILTEEEKGKDKGTIIDKVTPIREAFIENKSVCNEGEISSINSNGVVYMYLCKIYRLLINASIPGNATFSSARNLSFIGVVINETGNYTMLNQSFSSYRRVWAGIFNLSINVPSYARQGLVPVGNGYYSIANIPYIFFNISYLKGLGNASLIIRVTFSINDRNLSSPYIIEYYVNSNDRQFISPIEYPIPRDSLEESRDRLKPLLDIDAGQTVDLVFYIEVYAKVSGDFIVELEVGYPGIRIIGGG